MQWAAVLLAMVLFGAPATAQQDIGTADPDAVLGGVEAQVPAEGDGTRLTGAILVLNQDRLLSQSLYGQRVQAELTAGAEALTRENRAIEAQLTEEELRLTELRPATDPEDFAAMAADFDARVEGIRAAQDAKSRDLQAQADAARAQFFELATPILLDIVSAQGASVLLDNRSVLLSAQGIDVTDLALARIDAEIGDGGPEPLVRFETGTADRD